MSKVLMTRQYYRFSGMLIIWGAAIWFLTGCHGTQTFSNVARAGDTISVAAGLDAIATRDSVNISVQDSAGNIYTYLPGDPRIRAVMNLYPDPLSYFVVGGATRQNFRSSESDYGPYADAYLDLSDKRDWRQTIVFIDLPTSMAVGEAMVTVETSNETITSSTLQIVPGVGAPNPMDFTSSFGLAKDKLQSLEHMDSARVTIRIPPSSARPAAVEYRFTHDPDSTLGGAGLAHVTHARGDLAGVVWHDNGTQLRILVTSNMPADRFHRNIFSVSIAGGITGLQPDGMTAVDVDGNILTGPNLVMSPNLLTISPTTALVSGSSYTVQGTSLCIACDGSEDGIMLRGPSSRVQPTVTSISPNSATFTVPSGVGSGPGYIWIKHVGGSDVMPVQFQ